MRPIKSTKRRPVELDGVKYPSLSAAARAIGRSRQYVRFLLVQAVKVQRARYV